MGRTSLHRMRSVILLLVFSSAIAASQIRVGVHGGMNLSDITPPPDYPMSDVWEMRTFGFGGIVADCDISSHWQLAVEINFIQKGIRIPNFAWGLSLPGHTELTANYFEMPIAIRYRFGAGPFWWYLECGPSLSLLESGRAHTVAQALGEIPSTDEVREATYAFHDFEGSLRIGLGAEYEVTSTVAFTISGMYSHGLSYAFQNFWSKTHSRGAYFSLGVLLSV
jgi:hypothetical protein